ncbi:MAG: carboxypeptidase regulatory-like domain-containing protein, partial [Gemmatimonadaceae bacterium]
MTVVGRALALVVVLAAARVLDAQTVRGEIVDRATGRPAAGVVVQLLDAADGAVAQGFTDGRGQYRLTSPAPGAFRVRTLRIGFRPATSQTFTLAQGADVTLLPLHAGAPVALDTVRVVGRNSCEALSDARATFAIWEQARTALTAARIAAGSKSMNARIVSYERTSRLKNGDILSHHARVLTGFTRRAWRAIPLDSLRRLGYIATDSRGWLNYYAPDIDILLSDQFLADHCFRIAPESDRTRIGLAFQPTRERRGVPEIGGIIWLDRASSELRRLDFQYENVEAELQDAGAGGAVEFARLRNDAWMVSRWSIRMPIVEQRTQAVSGFGLSSRSAYAVVNDIEEEGGVLALVTQGNDTLFASVPLSITGVVQDSVTKRPLSGAHVLVRGTGLQTSTDTTGRFRLIDLLPGRYTIEAATAELDAVGVNRTADVTVTDNPVPVTIILPDLARVMSRLCPDARGGIVAGTVWRQRDSVGAPRVQVVAMYKEYRRNGSVLVEMSRVLNATTDLRGRFHVCGAPIDREIMLVAESDSGNSAPVSARIPLGKRLALADVVLSMDSLRNAVFTGTVMSDVNGAAIPDVQVLLPAVSRTAFTDAQGRFRISNVPPGTHDVSVRRIGYQQLTLRVPFAASQTVERRVLLSRVVQLDTVAVSARAELPSFDEHRRIGLGQFLTRDMLAKQESRRLSEVLSEVSGTNVVRGSRGFTAWLSASRGGRAGGGCYDLDGESELDRLQGKRCACYAQVYLDNMPLFLGRQMDEVPNLDRIPVSAIEAIEFYRSPAETPAKYSTLNSNCGVLVIHTRRTFEPDG